MPDIDLTQTILTEAALPRTSTSDGQSAEGQPIPDIIAADKHVATKTALAARKGNGWNGIGRARVVPPGGV